MRQVIFGRTASGKTRYGVDLIKQYGDRLDEVITNIPNKYMPMGTSLLQDNSREEQIFKHCRILRTMKQSLNNLELNMVSSLLSYLTRKGSVLILDDVNSLVPNTAVLSDILYILSEHSPLIELWNDVILLGYSWDLTEIVDDISSTSIGFITDTGRVKFITDEEEMYEYWLRTTLRAT